MLFLFKILASSLLFFSLFITTSNALDCGCDMNTSYYVDTTPTIYDDDVRAYNTNVPGIQQSCSAQNIAVQEYVFDRSINSDISYYDIMLHFKMCTVQPPCKDGFSHEKGECLNCDPNTQTYDPEFNICVDIPTCADDEIFLNDVCTRCPLGSLPNSDSSFCECVPPKILYTNVPPPRCIDPTVDSDGDGVPDDIDAFPTNANESSDNDGDRIGDNADTDDDNDGYSDKQEAREGTNPNDASSNGSISGGGSGTEPDGGGNNNGVDAYHDCPAGYVPDDDYDITFKCHPKNDDEEDCNHSPSRHGYIFQMITNASSCDISIRSSPEGRGWKDFLPNCSQGNYACFYNTTSSSNDSNTTPKDIKDSNATDSFDDSAIVNKLDQINNTNNNIFSSISSLNDSLGTQTSTLSDKLDKLQTQNHFDSLTLESALKGISSSIDLQSSDLSKGLTSTNKKLDGISDLLSDDIEIDIDTSLHDETFEGAKHAFDNALLSFEQTKNDLVNLSGGFTPPSMTASGSCSISTPVFRNGNYTIDLSILSTFRPYVQFVLNLVLLFFTLKLYVLIARDITSYFMGGL